MAKRKKRRHQRLVSQVERLPRFSEKPETVDYNSQSWPVSVKTGRRMSYNYIISTGFLKCFDWLRIRMAALANTDGRCECCGASAKDGVMLNVDHVKPRKEYPQLALSLHNLQVLCHDCNFGKGNDFHIHWKSI